MVYRDPTLKHSSISIISKYAASQFSKVHKFIKMFYFPSLETVCTVCSALEEDGDSTGPFSPAAAPPGLSRTRGSIIVFIKFSL